MPIYEFAQDSIRRLKSTTFTDVGMHERRDMQRLLRESVDVISPDTLVISDEFGEWQESKHRIDLLGIDKDANLVVIELKRTNDGGYMDLQAIRYASMVSKMTFEQATDTYERYLSRQGKEGQDARTAILDFLGWSEPDDDQFGQDVRIVLASGEFSKELTSSVLWLLDDHGLDIRCVRLTPYSLDGRLFVDVQQIIPLPEAADYQVRVREKAHKEREARASERDITRYNIVVGGQTFDAQKKRKAIFLVCKHLCENGVSPDDIAALFDWRPTRTWLTVSGTVDAAAFEALAMETARKNESNFDARRWFCATDELVHYNGMTYAFSNQWGGERWLKAMNLLKDNFAQFGIQYAPAS